MKVELIDYTGAGSSDPLYAARLLAYAKSTRLEQSADTREKFRTMPEEELNAELDYIANTIRSSWEFVEFTFQINGVTRAFTHQLVRTRTGRYAQQAQRVVDMSNGQVTLPDTISAAGNRAIATWNGVCDAIFGGYQELQRQGIPNQDCRGLLPTNINTNIIAKFDLRTLADLLGKRKNLRTQGEYADVAREMERCVLEVMPWTKQFLNPERTATPALDEILKLALGDQSPIDAPAVNEALKELDKLKGIWG